MASSAQVANDLRRWAGMLHGTGQDELCRSLARGASTILELQEKIAALEAAAENEVAAFEAHRQGEDLHGT
jgi:hypothetical protein